MKFLIASDIHGSLLYAKKVVELFEKEQANTLILLGDLYYHGPRNPLPEEYNPKEVANLLNTMKDKLYVVRGNCDAEVDEMISEFTFNENIRMNIGGKKIMFTHGHHYNIDNLPKDFDILIYGHFHTGFIKEKDHKIFVNAGSTTLPKNNTPHSYLILENNHIILKDLDQNIIDEIEF